MKVTRTVSVLVLFRDSRVLDGCNQLLLPMGIRVTGTNIPEMVSEICSLDAIDLLIKEASVILNPLPAPDIPTVTFPLELQRGGLSKTPLADVFVLEVLRSAFLSLKRENQREHPRYADSRDISWRPFSHSQLLTAKCINSSRGGMSLSCEQSLPEPGDLIEIHGDDREVTLSLVRWVQGGFWGTESRMGVEHIAIS